MDLLYDSGEMSVSGPRERVRVYRVPAGVAVLYDFLTDQPSMIVCYTKYPSLPDDWLSFINVWGTTAADAWLHDLEGYQPDCREHASTMTVSLAAAISGVSERGIRLAAKNGYIPGAHKVGRDWVIPFNGLWHYINNRPKRGKKSSLQKGD